MRNCVLADAPERWISMMQRGLAARQVSPVATPKFFVTTPFATLLPATFAVVACDPRTFESCEISETKFVKHAVIHRRREFVAGRLCAHIGLRTLGAPKTMICPAEDRRPIWPLGYSGSISHCQDYCAAAVARDSDHASVGIDVEGGEDLDAALVRVICTPDERSFLTRTSSTRPGRLAKLIFSIKESVYKFDYQIHRHRYDFQNVEIYFDKQMTEYIATIFGIPGGFRRVRGRYKWSVEHVFSSAFADD
jgi:4'-phosphopantetheinyl transferase EntD